MEHLIEIDGMLLSSNASLSGDAEMNRSLQLDGEIMMDSGGETETIEIDGALEFSASSVSGDVGTSAPMLLDGEIRMGGGGYPEYEGQYEVRPLANEKVVLPTKDRVLLKDVTVDEVPYFETSNKYGETIYIASEV